MSSAAVNSGVGEGRERGWGDKGAGSPSRGGTVKKPPGERMGSRLKRRRGKW